MSGETATQNSVHTSYDAGTDSAAPDAVLSFSFPPEWQAYQDDRFGAAERLDRESFFQSILEKSGITKISTILGPDNNRLETSIFTINVQEAIENVSRLGTALTALDESVTRPMEQVLLTVLKQLHQDGVNIAHYMPSKGDLYQVGADIKNAFSSLSLKPDETVIFGWSGTAVAVRADITPDKLYQHVMENI